MRRYKVFHPLINGVRRWALNAVENGNRRRIIVHPETGEPFQSRAEVEALIEDLRGQQVRGSGARVKELAKHLFTPGGPWAQRQARRRGNRPLAPHTLQEHELNVRLHIIPGLGEEALADLTSESIDDWIYSLDMSNRGRRNVAATLVRILKEAKRRQIIQVIPNIELPSKQSAKPSTLTLQELKQLFPCDKASLRDLWGDPRERARREPKEAGLAIAACASVLFFGGLRPQEARAVAPEQLLKKLSVLLVTRSMSSEGKVLPYLKMGGERDPRYRGTFLIDWAMRILDAWLSTGKQQDFLFTYQGAPIRPELLHSRLQVAIERSEIPAAGRRIIPYSGRYTFDSIFRPILPQEVLMAIMGHIDPAMPEHYDQPVLEDRMRQLAPWRKKLNEAIE